MLKGANLKWAGAPAPPIDLPPLDASILGIGSDPVIFCGSGIGQTRPIQIQSCAFKLIIFCVVVKPHGSHTNTIKHHTVFIHYISSVLELFHSLI